MRFLVTGSAGFIGFHLARRLLNDGHVVVGFDALTEYYDKRLKISRHELLARSGHFHPVIGRLEDDNALDAASKIGNPDFIVHLAAQAGVRYSIESPQEYIDANLVGSFKILELARRLRPSHLLLASTSSIYGGNPSLPFSEQHAADWPLSLYAATKKSMEAMSHSYAHLWDIPTTCFRFFTVYGPWGRPDMALFKFVSAALSGRPIEVYGMGQMRRDFTYVDDLVEAINRLIAKPPVKNSPECTCDAVSATAPWRVVNIGGGQPIGLLEFIEAIEGAIGFPIKRTMLPMQAGDMRETFADPQLLIELTGYRPHTPVEQGVAAFVEWYREHYQHALAE